METYIARSGEPKVITTKKGEANSQDKRHQQLASLLPSLP
jgi:hypothetical protein